MATPLVEEYLEAIYHMSADGVSIIGARLVEKFGVSAPTVTTTLKRMSRDGFITVNERKEVVLTDKGRQVAESMLRRHRLSERLLTDVLGIEWHKVHAEACRIEHSLSPEVEEKLSVALGNPSTCPHGNPIPGNPSEPERPTVTLLQAKVGDEVLVVRISEVAEDDDELMAYLQQQGLTPGTTITLMERAPFNGPITLKGRERTVAIGPEVAAKVWVAALGERSSTPPPEEAPSSQHAIEQA